MFGDFGSSQRHRIPRDHSPFDTFNRSHRPIFSDRDWDTPSMHRSGSVGKGSPSESNRGSGVERIIPIRVVGSPSPPPAASQQAQQTSDSSNADSTRGTSPAPSAPIVLGWPTDNPPAGVGGNPKGEIGERKYSTQRHNTMDNLQVNPPATENQRAKSEPPNINWTNGTNGTPRGPTHPNVPSNSSPPFPEQPKEAVSNGGTPTGMQFGGNKSKVRNGDDMGTGCRNIPITVESRPSGGGLGGFFKKSQNTTAATPSPQPSKTRSQPDHPEPTTTPPPPKKVTKDTMQIIQEIIKEVQGFEVEVQSLPFTPKSDKKYIYLDEMLTRNLIKLDTIETEGREDIRQSRKDCIKLIQNVINILEAKSQETVVPFNPPTAGVTTDVSSDLVPMQLALVPTTSVTTSEIATADAAMDVSPPIASDSMANIGDGEPMVVDKVATTTTA